MLQRKHTITEELPAFYPSVLHPGDTTLHEGTGAIRSLIISTEGRGGSTPILCSRQAPCGRGASAQHPLPLPAPTNLLSNTLENTREGSKRRFFNRLKRAFGESITSKKSEVFHATHQMYTSRQHPRPRRSEMSLC